MREPSYRTTRFATFAGVIALSSSLLSCLVPGYTVVDPEDRIDLPPPGKALVILLYASKFTDPPPNLFLDDRFIVTLRTGTHLAIVLDPGSYRFMVLGENIGLMDATVSADNTYHALVNAWIGFSWGDNWGHFEFKPFNGPDAQLQKWYDVSQQVVPDAAGAEFGARALERKKDEIREFTIQWEDHEDRAHLRVPTSH